MTDRRNVVVLRYHEIALKGRNRPFFVRRLAEHVTRVTAGLPVGSVHRASARLMLALRDPAAWPEVRTRLARVFGLANFSLAHEVALEGRGGDPQGALARLGNAIVASLQDVPVPSFRVQTKRADKTFPLPSPEVNRVLGAIVREATGARVDLDHGAVTLTVEILPGRALFSVEKRPGAGGLPVGVSGRVLALLSGGIDSPVAAWRMMRRGCRVDFVHFHSTPFLDRTSQDKARELVRLLVSWELEATLLLVPFGEVQRRIVAAVLRPLRVVLYRRMMLRIAEALARERGAEALVTGESLGQVASQTLTNLAVIAAAAVLPVLRPLVGMDKDEITAAAAEIGTLETSLVPDQDCCQLFVPRHPATRARSAEVAAAEARLDPAALVALAIAGVEEVHERFPPVAERRTPAHRAPHLAQG
jgi:thiamine biosynthesis protein ThiI